MIAYIVRRLVWAVAIVLAVGVITFVLTFVAPADPARSILGFRASPEAIEQTRRALGLDGSIPEQLAAYLGRLLRGDLGRSYQLNADVRSLILARFPATLELAAAGLAVSVAVGIPLGIAAARRPGGWVDRVSGVFSSTLVSIPAFLLGYAVLYLFAFQPAVNWGIDILPIGQYEPLSIRHLILPALTLGLTGAAFYTRIARTTMLDELHHDYVRTARAKGASERRVTGRHAFRNALPLVLTQIGLDFGFFLGGVVVVENVFSWPGIGRLAVDAISAEDIPVLMGTVLFATVCIVLANLAVDLAYAFLDPRVRYG